MSAGRCLGAALAALAFFACGQQLSAAPIPVFSTGVAANGTLLTQGVADPHYLLTLNTAGTGATTFVTVADGFPITGAWFAQGPNSQWIEPTSGTTDTHPAGAYNYQTTFDLTGLDPSTARITFIAAVDNSVTNLLINGNSTGITFSGFGAFSGPFTISSGFVSGLNTLEFDTVNGAGSSGNPTGLRVEISSATATALPPPPVPEPSTLLLFGLGSTALAGWRRWRSASKR